MQVSWEHIFPINNPAHYSELVPRHADLGDLRLHVDFVGDVDDDGVHNIEVGIVALDWLVGARMLRRDNEVAHLDEQAIHQYQLSPQSREDAQSAYAARRDVR